MIPSHILANLRSVGLIKSGEPVFTPLAGGVSCEIQLVEDSGRRFVIKQALEKLRVKDDWFADPARNQFEQAYMRYADAVVPGSVPRVLHADCSAGFFAMEYLGDGWRNWKTELLAARANPLHAEQAGDILGRIHSSSWESPTLREEFATTENFRQLRIEPYLLTTAARNPALEPWFRAEAERLASARVALVHGDFSPKNILLHVGGRFVVLDCEVAWFGDPAFDVAFLTNHFFLKAIHLPQHAGDFLALVPAFLSAYRQALGRERFADVETRAARLLPMLLLARVDGKSPVEYLVDNEHKQQAIRDFAHRIVPTGIPTYSELTALWAKTLDNL